MNTSHDDDRDTVSDDMAVDATGKRIIRHVDSNDSYREALSADDTEDFTQASLAQEESMTSSYEIQESDEVVDVKKQEQEESVAQETPEEQVESLEETSSWSSHEDDDINTETFRTEPKPHLLSQEEILASSEVSSTARGTVTSKESISSTDTDEVSNIPTALASNQEPVVAIPEIILKTDTVPDSVSIENSVEATTSAPVVYHTVSGGPETIHDKMTGSLPSQSSGPQSHATQPGMSSASGYTIPSQEYASRADVVDVIEEGNIGIGLSLLVMAVIGGCITYVYFFLPSIFDQAFDSIMVIKDQIIKK